MVAAELGEAVELVETATEAGQAALREVSAIRKIPVAICDGRTLFDSRVIIDWLTTTRGWGGLSPPRDRWHDLNLVNAIDAAADSAIQVFYLKRDGVDAKAFGERQLARVEAIFGWLGTQLASDGRGFGSGLGLAEISLVCTLDWMDFRKAFPTERAGAAVAGVRAAWADRPSLAGSRPHA